FFAAAELEPTILRHRLMSNRCPPSCRHSGGTRTHENTRRRSLMNEPLLFSEQEKSVSAVTPPLEREKIAARPGRSGPSSGARCALPAATQGGRTEDIPLLTLGSC